MEEIKELIAKIQKEGVQAAEEKARQIENEAHKTAADILHKAKAEAEKIIRETKENCSQMQAAGHNSLKQAGRDMLLSLKKEINVTLERVILKEIRHALNSEELQKIIISLIKQHSQKENAAIEILLSPEDLKNLEGSLLEKLKGELKKGLVLKPSQDILAGFSISFDGGKSYFDFTDASLAEYIANYLKPQLAEILK
jgi:V/A-type H+-transporting ATPase subunit E